MLRLIVLKEIREIVYSTKFVLTFGAMSVLILLSFYTGALNYQHARQEAEATAAEVRQSLENRTAWSDISISTYLEPRPLEAVVTGVVNDISRRRVVRIQNVGRVGQSRYSTDPVWALFQSIDLEFILTVVLSLFAIVFAYDSVSGERERGTLSLAMSNAVPRDTLLLGKTLGSFAALFIPLLIPLLLGAALLPLLEVPMAAGDWLRLALIMGCSGIYLSIFLALSVFVSCLVRRSSSSFLALSLMWVLIVIVLPRISIFAAGRAVDVPSAAEIGFESQKTHHDLFEQNRDKLAEFSQRRDVWSMSRAEFDAAWSQFFGEIMAGVNQTHADHMARVDEEARNAKLQRDRLALWFARVSPAACMRLAATTLADTGPELDLFHDEALREYQKTIKQFVIGKEGVSAFAGRNMKPFGPGAEIINPAELPRMTRAERSLRTTLSEALPSFLILGVYCLLAFSAAVIAFRRSDIRQPEG